MIMWTTHWALTSGIKEVEGHWTEDKKYFLSKSFGHTCFSPKEVHLTLVEAQVVAKAMAKRRADKLRNQAAQLDSRLWEPKVIHLKEK